MQTTLNKIRENSPCSDGWNKLLKSQGKVKPDNDQIDLIDILKSNGIEDAVWCLRCFDYKEYCLFLADVAESVLSIYENKYPNDQSPRKSIEAIRNYEKGLITKDQLDTAAAAAYATAYAAYAAAAAAAAYATAYAAAAYDAAAYATAYATNATAYAANAAANAAAAAAAARKSKWYEIEELFIKHFG